MNIRGRRMCHRGIFDRDVCDCETGICDIQNVVNYTLLSRRLGIISALLRCTQQRLES